MITLPTAGAARGTPPSPARSEPLLLLGLGTRAGSPGTRGHLPRQGRGDRAGAAPWPRCPERVPAASHGLCHIRGMLRASGATRALWHSPASLGNGCGPAGPRPRPLPSCRWHFCFFSVKPPFGLFCPKQTRAVAAPCKNPTGLQLPPGSGCWAVPPPRHVLL